MQTLIEPTASMIGTQHAPTLEEMETAFADTAACRSSCQNLTEQAIYLAAIGHAEDILRIVQRTSEKALFLPLADGLRLHLGMMVESSGAARSLATYIAGRIRQQMELQVTTT